jgi:putative lipoprotein (rSAM/lipoprotein system)
MGKKIVTGTLGIIKSITAVLVGLLGFSCPPGIVALYGMPTATFEVSGKVTDAYIGDPVDDIQVTLTRTGETGGDPVIADTDANGDYVMVYQTMYPENMEFTLSFDDVDGLDNGAYTNTSENISVSDTDFIDDDDNSWTTGHYEQTLNVELAPE